MLLSTNGVTEPQCGPIGLALAGSWNAPGPLFGAKEAFSLILSLRRSASIFSAAALPSVTPSALA